MKLGSKKITGTLIIFSTLLLTACGGGSNQSNDKKSDDESSEQNALYKVYYQPSNVSLGLITDFFEITTYPIQGDQINFNKSHNQPLDRRILTESKILEVGTAQSNVLKRLTPIQWRYERTSELQQDLSFELVQLDGQNVFDRVLPGYRENIDLSTNETNGLNQNLIKFYQNYKDTVFPKNSICYRLKETQWNQNHITQVDSFDSPSFTEVRERIVNQYEGLKYSPISNQSDYQLVWGNWHGYDWIFLLNNLDVEETVGTLGNVTDQSAYAIYISSQPWLAEQSLSYARDQLNSFEKYDRDNQISQMIILGQKMRIANLEKGCFAFNSQAFKTLKKLNLINWKQGDSSDVGQFFGSRTIVDASSE